MMIPPYDPAWNDRKEFPIQHHICMTCPKCEEIKFTFILAKSYRCCVNPTACFEVAWRTAEGVISNSPHSNRNRSPQTKTPLNCAMYFEYSMFYDDTGENAKTGENKCP